MKPIVLAIVSALVLSPATAQAEAPDRTHKVDMGTTFTWEGNTALGLNLLYFGDPVTGGNATYECGDDTDNYCDTVLFEFSNPLTQADIDAGKTFKSRTATITVGNFGPVPDPVTDFDLRLYQSDAQGTQGEFLGQSANFGPDQDGDESYSTPIRTTVAEPSKFILAEIIYFAVANSKYTGTAQF